LDAATLEKREVVKIDIANDAVEPQVYYDYLIYINFHSSDLMC